MCRRVEMRSSESFFVRGWMRKETSSGGDGGSWKSEKTRNTDGVKFLSLGLKWGFRIEILTNRGRKDGRVDGWTTANQRRDGSTDREGDNEEQQKKKRKTRAFLFTEMFLFLDLASLTAD